MSQSATARRVRLHSTNKAAGSTSVGGSWLSCGIDTRMLEGEGMMANNRLRVLSNGEGYSW